MRLTWCLFALLVAMCVVLTVTLTVPESDVGHGFEHPEYSRSQQGMQQGGSGLERHSRVLWLGWLFGILEISLFVCCLALGASKRGRVGKLAWPLAIGLVLFLSAYTAMIFVYREYMGETSHSLVLSFPAPTAVMLFVLWPLPAYFTLVYILNFDRCIMTPEDTEKFRKILQARRQREEKGG